MDQSLFLFLLQACFLRTWDLWWDKWACLSYAGIVQCISVASKWKTWWFGSAPYSSNLEMHCTIISSSWGLKLYGSDWIAQLYKQACFLILAQIYSSSKKAFKCAHADLNEYISHSLLDAIQWFKPVHFVKQKSFRISNIVWFTLLSPSWSPFSTVIMLAKSWVLDKSWFWVEFWVELLLSIGIVSSILFSIFGMSEFVFVLESTFGFLLSIFLGESVIISFSSLLRTLSWVLFSTSDIVS